MRLTSVPSPPAASAASAAAPLDATAEKLIEAAGQVFAGVGFQAATVRDICGKAGANVAAVNYHFGDKVGLYLAVLSSSFCMREHELAREALSIGGAPEERFRHFVRMFCQRMFDPERPSWYMKIIAHELAQPTPALGQVVGEVILPNYQRLCALIGELIGRPALDDATRRCVHSVMGQIMHYSQGRAVIAHLWPRLEFTPKRIDELAEHIAAFSLAGFAASAKKPAKKRKTQ